MPRRSPFLNRELSWLQFNRRVLDEAHDAGVPLLERLKFLAITGSNLDEFFMVRVGGLQQLAEHDPDQCDPSGLTPGDQLATVREVVHGLTAAQYACLTGLETKLRPVGIARLRVDELSDEQQEHVDRLFQREILPVVTPVAVRSFGAFPLLPGLGVNIGVRLGAGPSITRRDRFAVVAVPKVLGRVVPLPSEKGYAYMLLEDIIGSHLRYLFPGEAVAERIVFRITRNADLAVREDQAGDLLASMQRILWQRRQSACVRLEVESASPDLLRLVVKAVGATPRDVYELPGPLDLSVFMGLATATGFESLRDTPWKPQTPPDIEAAESMFEVISRRDVLLYHPYESFDPIVRLVEEAAADRDVLAIKQILYRTSKSSQIVAALALAAERGKHVTALVELKARFDEARNIEWARALETSGVQVIYGIKGLKTHAKILIIVRREVGGIRRYVHFGTGNYNEITARLYTDVSYMTCRDDFAADASLFFNIITGQSQPVGFQKLAAAPLDLRRRLLDLIEGETQRAKQGQEARIMAKLNSLADPEIIRALCKAARAGVQVALNVRGVCCLRPGVAGQSENITVLSVVDRFLEHARIFCFHHGGKQLVLLSSADWMPRNMDRRIELMVPVEDPDCRARLIGILEMCLRDSAKGAMLQSDGAYRRLLSQGREKPFRSQDVFYQEACEQVRAGARSQSMVFQPHRPTGTEA